MTEVLQGLRNEGFESTPEGSECGRLAEVKRQHGVVMDTRFLHVRQLRQEETKVHDISPSVWLDAVHGKPADMELGRTMHAAKNVYPLSLGKRKVGRHMG